MGLIENAVLDNDITDLNIQEDGQYHTIKLPINEDRGHRETASVPNLDLENKLMLNGESLRQKRH